MTSWQLLLGYLGGGGILMGSLAWLLRSLVTYLLSKDVEAHKALLSANAATELEKAKYALQLAAFEHQTRYARLHEKRADVVARTFEMLVQTERAVRRFVYSGKESQHQSNGEASATASDSVRDLYNFFESNRIYLPEQIAQQLDSLIKQVRAEIVGFGAYAIYEDANLGSSALDKKMDASMRFEKYIEEEFPKARAELEANFRSLLEPSNAP